MKFTTLKANKQHEIGAASRNTTVLIVFTGNFGTGSLTFGTLDKAGEFAQFTDPAPVTAPGSVKAFLGKGTKLVISLSGVIVPNINVGFAGDYFMFAPEFNKKT